MFVFFLVLRWGCARRWSAIAVSLRLRRLHMPLGMWLIVLVFVAEVLYGQCGTAAFACSFSDSGSATKLVFDSCRDIFVDGAGMRLLLLNAEVRQKIQNHIWFYFQFTRQLINPDLQLHRMMYCVGTVV